MMTIGKSGVSREVHLLGRDSNEGQNLSTYRRGSRRVRGAPRVAGTRITVALIAEAVEHLGMSPDDVVQMYPRLDLAKVHGALTYYHDHVKEVEASIRHAKRVEASLRRRFPPRAKDMLLKRLG